MRRLGAVSAALLVVLAACGSGSSGKAASTTASTAPPTTAAPTTVTTAGPCVPGATAGPFTATGSSTSLLTDVVTAAAGCADTVTFTFRPGAAPGYEISSKPGPFQDAGSGNPHPVSGNAFVVVRFHPAAIADFMQPSAPPSYTGPKSIHPTGVAHVTDVELT
jgi:hypothetical protein